MGTSNKYMSVDSVSGIVRYNQKTRPQNPGDGRS